MMIRPWRAAPGIVARRLTIFRRPAGVSASKACASVAIPAAFICRVTYSRVAAAPRKIAFKTPDGWTLAADYRPPRKGGMVMVLAHGVASSKNEWERFAARLSSQGVGSLAVDLRGHGESTKGPKGERDFKDFDATGEWVEAVADLRAAASWLEARGVISARIAFGGASIGANLASQDRLPLFAGRP